MRSFLVRFNLLTLFIIRLRNNSSWCKVHWALLPLWLLRKLITTTIVAELLVYNWQHWVALHFRYLRSYFNWLNQFFAGVVLLLHKSELGKFLYQVFRFLISSLYRNTVVRLRVLINFCARLGYFRLRYFWRFIRRFDLVNEVEFRWQWRKIKFSFQCRLWLNRLLFEINYLRGFAVWKSSLSFDRDFFLLLLCTFLINALEFVPRFLEFKV